MPGPESEVENSGNQPKVLVQPVGDRPERRDHHVDAPEAEDHRGDGGEHLDDGAEDARQPGVEEVLGQEDRHADAEEAGDDRAPGSSCRACPRSRRGCRTRSRPGSQTAVVRKPKPCARIAGAACDADLPEDVGEQQDHQRAGGEGECAEDPVGQDLAPRRRPARSSGRGSSSRLRSSSASIIKRAAAGCRRPRSVPACAGPADHAPAPMSCAACADLLDDRFRHRDVAELLGHRLAVGQPVFDHLLDRLRPLPRPGRACRRASR